MLRINTTNKAVDLFGAGKHGYQGGNPSTGQAATELSFDAMNALQEEIAAAIEGSGAALNPASNGQLLAAIRALSQTLGDGRYAALSGFTYLLAASGYQRFPSGLIIQWGSAVTSASVDTAITFPITFPFATYAVLASPASSGAGAFSTITPVSTTGATLNSWTATATRASYSTSWIAIGH